MDTYFDSSVLHITVTLGKIQGDLQGGNPRALCHRTRTSIQFLPGMGIRVQLRPDITTINFLRLSQSSVAGIVHVFMLSSVGAVRQARVSHTLGLGHILLSRISASDHEIPERQGKNRNHSNPTHDTPDYGSRLRTR